MEVINWRIAGHPLNWITLFLMVFIAALAIHFTLTLFGQVPQSQKQANQAAGITA
jgi:hypothetical protein